MKYTAAALMLGFVTLGANAQPVYRCGSAYSQTPCPQGRLIEATNPPTAAQRAGAMRVAADERVRAAEMQRERLVAQAALKPSAATSLSGQPVPPARAASAVERGHAKKKKRSLAKPATTTDFVALDPGSRMSRSR